LKICRAYTELGNGVRPTMGIFSQHLGEIQKMVCSLRRLETWVLGRCIFMSVQYFHSHTPVGYCDQIVCYSLYRHSSMQEE
jgi:hypothetical protein